ncbi:putative F-box domain-containing protein [Helianthus anomalus]
MGTLEEQEEEQSTTNDHQLAKKAKVSLPVEIIADILSRLPVKSILRFRSLSKPWLSHISHPSFTKLHFTCASAAHRTPLFISTYDYSTYKRHFLSAAHDNSGSVTHLMTLDNACSNDITNAQHLNGLVCFTCKKGLFNHNYAHIYVLNPSTHKVFKLTDPDYLMNQDYKNVRLRYLFGFDDSRNEHKILIMKNSLFKPTTMEIMIFSLSSYSWRTIHLELPDGFSWDNLKNHDTIKDSVCVNSVVHLAPCGPYDILAFDLRTEHFSVIRTPQSVAPRKSSTVYTRNGKTLIKDNHPDIININGFLGVVCHDRVVESKGMRIWVLQDYEKRVWVRETITFHESWIDLYCPFPLDAVNMDEIIFSSNKVLRNKVMSVLTYNKKNRCFKSLQFTLGHQFVCSKAIKVEQISFYVESLVPL